MAVFPDKIVQKNSTDAIGDIASQIADNGTDPIIGGELVLARGLGSAQLLALDANGTPVIVGQGNTNPAKEPSILINFEDEALDTPYVYAASEPLNADSKFGSFAYKSVPFLPSTPRPNAITIQAAQCPLLGVFEWTLEFFIKVDPTDWLGNNLQSLLVWSHKDYLFGPGAFTITLDGGTTDTVDGIGTDTSQTSGQAKGSIVFGLGGQYGTHGNPYVPTEGDIVSSRSTTVMDGNYHHVVFSHEGYGRYTCHVDGVLRQRTTLQAPVDHNNSGTTGTAQPSGVIISGVVNINDEMPFPGTEFFGFRGLMDSIVLYAGAAKYKGQDTISVPTAPFDNTPYSTPDNTLAALYDTNIGAPITDGDVLQYDGTDGAWKNSPAPAYNISGNDLGDLGDVTLEAASAIADNETIVWDNSLQGWKNYALQTVDLDDVLAGTLSHGDLLRFDSSLSKFINGPVDYSEINNRVTNLSQLNNDSLNQLGKIPDVNLNGLADLDTLVYDAGSGKWTNASAPPVSLAANTLSDLGDVGTYDPFNTPVDSVMAYQGSSGWVAKQLDITDITNAPLRITDLTRDVNVSYWPNDVGYLNTIGGQSIFALFDTQQDGTPQESQVLVYRSGKWKNEYGPPANISTNSIGDLADCTYYQQFNYLPGELTVEGMGTIHFDAPNQASNIRYDVSYVHNSAALCLEAIRTSDESGSSMSVSRGGGVDLRSDVNLIRLRGKPDATTSRPEVRFETGDYSLSPPTGNAISFKMPDDVLEDVVYYLPQEDGDVGDVLATDGSGVLSWVARVQNNDLGQLSDVDLATQLPADGNALVYNAVAQLWVPGAVSNVDLSTSSINTLQDVDTSTTPPADGQGLGWDSTLGVWQPMDVAPDLSTESIDALSDVDTTTTTPTTGQGLVWDGTQWAPGDVSDVDLATSSIDDLSDVDTSTSAPTDGQALLWDAVANEWQPGTVAVGGQVLSVNGQTGTVSLGIGDLDDVQITPAIATSLAYHDAPQISWNLSDTTQGGYHIDATNIYINKNNPTSGQSLATQGFAAGTSLDLYISADGTTFEHYTFNNSFNQAANNAQFNSPTPSFSSTITSASALYFSLTNPVGPGGYIQDDEFLQYDSSDSKFKPAALAAVASSGDYNDLINAPSSLPSRIQDQTDFALQQVAPAGVTVGRWEYNGTTWNAISAAIPAGETHHVRHNSQDYLALSLTDADGNDQTNLLTSIFPQNVSGSLWYSTDGQTYTEQAYGVNSSVGSGADAGRGFRDISSSIFSGLSAGDSIYIADASASLQDVPLATGDALIWEGSNFRPNALAAVATSGDYNDLTNAPTTLASRIQDATDFELNPGSVVLNNWTNGGVGGPEDVSAGEVVRHTSSSFTYWIWRYDANGVDVYTAQRFPDNGDTNAVWYSTDGGQTFTETTYVGYETNETNVLSMASMPSGLVGNFAISFTDPALVPDAPLADGDIIRWVNADLKFKPAQLATVATSGDYNDLSNQPSPGITRIQDADDFSLNNQPPQSFRYSTYKGIYTQSSTTVPDVGDDGTFGWNGYAGEALILAYIDSDGEDVQAAFNTAGGESSDPTLWASTDNGLTWVEISTQEARDFSGRLQFWADEDLAVKATSDAFALGYDYAISTSHGPGEILVTFQDPTGATPEIPLATGDILEWQDSVSDFKPTTLATVARSGDYNDLINQPSITVVDRIQDQTDFMLNQAPAPTPFYDNPTHTDGNGHYGVSAHPSNYWMWIYKIDANGTDHTTYVNTVQASGTTTVWYSEDGINWSSIGGITLTTSSDRFYLSGISHAATLAISNYASGNLYINFDDPAGNVFDIPIADGDFIRYNSTDAKFKPIQLSAVATSGDYSDLINQPALVNRIQDQTDFDLNVGSVSLLEWNFGSNSVSGNASSGSINGSNTLFVNRTDRNGITFDETALPATGTLYASTDGTTWYDEPYSFDASFSNADRVAIDTEAHVGTNFGGGSSLVIYLSFNAPAGTPPDVPLADGDYLRWNATDQKFKPAQLTGSNSALDDLTDVSAASPSAGFGIFWDGSQWLAGLPEIDGGEIT